MKEMTPDETYLYQTDKYYDLTIYVFQLVEHDNENFIALQFNNPFTATSHLNKITEEKIIM